MNKKIIITEDGSKTIFVPELNEHYHSTHGAIQESMHVFIRPGLRELSVKEINIFELGFGTGLNAFLTAIEAERLNIKVNYDSIEKYPLDSEITASLNYPDFFKDVSGDLFTKIHSCTWNKKEKISDNFNLMKIEGDIENYSPGREYDIIYFDAFGPEKQSELWHSDIVNKLALSCKKGGLFLSYSSRGQLKRQLISCNYNVEHIPGPPGKREITRATRL
jgi:tRNA U34 5-methylaminomethyl-2-thiouridine-forming methyltransferase MnmC